MKNSEGSNKEKHLKLRARENDAVGLVITYMQSSLINQQDLASEVLRGRFLPFALDRDHPQFKEVAVSCANACESWAKAIREYAELDIHDTAPPIEKPSTNTKVEKHQSTEELKEDEDEYDEEEEEDLELKARKEARLKKRQNSGI